MSLYMNKRSESYLKGEVVMVVAMVAFDETIEPDVFSCAVSILDFIRTDYCICKN